MRSTPTRSGWSNVGTAARRATTRNEWAMRWTTEVMRHTATMPQILLAGAPTGCWTNLGDEAILAGMAASLRAAVPGAELAVVSSNPAGFLDRVRVHGGALRRRRRASRSAVAESDLVLLGGGSIFFDYWGCDPETVLTPRHQGLALWAGIALLAAAYGTPVMVYGAGVGPLRTPRRRAARPARRSSSPGRSPCATRTPGPRSTGWACPVFGHRSPATRRSRWSCRPSHRRAGIARWWAWPCATGTSTSTPTGGPPRWPPRSTGSSRETGGSALFVPCHRGVAWPLSDDSGAGDARPRAHGAPGPHHDRRRRASRGPSGPPSWAACDLVLGMRYHVGPVRPRGRRRRWSG